jgi:two-component system invasion response regulator UvrY
MSSVLLVDPLTLVRQALRRVIEDELGASVIAEADNCDAVLRMGKNFCPDWLVMEPGRHPVAILDTLNRLRCSCEHTRIVLMTSERFLPFMDRVFQAGINACVSKSNGVNELREAFETVRCGRKFVSRCLAQSMLHESNPGREQVALQKLSNRELQIMHLFVLGNKVEQIAQLLCLSPKTVSTYRYRIFDKLEVRNDVALTHIARKHGFLEGTIARQPCTA